LVVAELGLGEEQGERSEGFVHEAVGVDGALTAPDSC
jgi:hypothetical protein